VAARSRLYQVAPEDTAESEFWALNYSFRPELSATTYALFAVKSNSNTETSGAIGVIGKGTIIGGRAVRPLAGSNNLFHSVIFGLDYKDFDQSVGFEDTFDTPIKYVNWTTGYTGVIFEGGREHNLNAFANAGVRGVVNEADQFTENRQGTKPNYFYLRGSYDLLQPTPLETAVFFRLSGQWTAQPLISNEQFSIGGVDTVRGFYEAEALGDLGVHATVELRSPDFGVPFVEQVTRNYLFAFTEGGALRNESTPNSSGEDSSVQLASAGIGWRFEGLSLTGNLNWARTLQAGPETPDGDDRLLFLLRYGF
jgi:hemolysin activation/secretion protein